MLPWTGIMPDRSVKAGRRRTGEIFPTHKKRARTGAGSLHKGRAVPALAVLRLVKRGAYVWKTRK